MAIEIIRLNLIPEGNPPVVHCKQYDKGRVFQIVLYNGKDPYILTTETIELNIRKSDKHIVTADLPFVVGEHCIDVTTTEQMCAVAGKNTAEIRIIRDGINIGTLNFFMQIERSPMEGGLQSDSEINNLRRQIEDIAEPIVEEITPPIVEQIVPQVIGDNYYTKTQTDALLDDKADKANTYDKSYIDTALSGKANVGASYTKSEENALLDEKANVSDVNNALANKMDKANPTGTGSLSLNRQSGSTVGENSVAMGTNTRATGTNTTALGNDTIAYGTNGVAMGNGTTARDENAVAMGMGTRALGKNQFVFGKYNSDNNYNNFVEIVGKGNVFARSNARTLDWSGNEVLAGDLTYNGNKSITSEVQRLDDKIDNLPEPMVFKGTLGVGGTIQSLPTASAENEGWMFKCITAGTYAGLTLKVGDTVTCFNPPNTSTYYWDKTGSQDTDTDTWRAIKVNGVEKLGNGISSGAVDFEDTTNVKFGFDANGNKISATLSGIYTTSEVNNLLDNKADKSDTYTKEQVDAIVDSILPTDSVSKSAIATFETDLAKPIELKAYIEAVQASGTPTPSTPLPISGWSQIGITRCGKNLVDIRPFNEWETARVSYYVLRNSVPNKVINVSLIDKDTTVDLTGISFGFVDSSWDTTQQLTASEYRWVIQGGTPQTIKRNTAIGNSKIVLTGLMFSPQTEEAYNKIMARYYFEFEIDTATEYEAYNPNSQKVTIALGDTYYGGYVTQDKDGHRQLVVTHKKYIIDSQTPVTDLSYTQSQGDYAQISFLPYVDEGISGAVFVCSAFEYQASNVAHSPYKVWSSATAPRMFFGLPTTIANRNEALAWFTDNPTTIIAPLAEPITVALPDGEPINALIGTNNLFADSGDMECSFKCGVAMYVDNHSGGGNRSLAKSVEEEVKEEEPKDEPITRQER